MRTAHSGVQRPHILEWRKSNGVSDSFFKGTEIFNCPLEVCHPRQWIRNNSEKVMHLSKSLQYSKHARDASGKMIEWTNGFIYAGFLPDQWWLFKQEQIKLCQVNIRGNKEV